MNNEQIKQEIKSGNSRSVRAIAGGSLLITAALLINIDLPFLNIDYSNSAKLIAGGLGLTLLLSLLKR